MRGTRKRKNHRTQCQVFFFLLVTLSLNAYSDKKREKEKKPCHSVR
jgi:hypothetical protein